MSSHLWTPLLFQFVLHLFFIPVWISSFVAFLLPLHVSLFIKGLLFDHLSFVYSLNNVSEWLVKINTFHNRMQLIKPLYMIINIIHWCWFNNRNVGSFKKMTDQKGYFTHISETYTLLYTSSTSTASCVLQVDQVLNLRIWLHAEVAVQPYDSCYSSSLLMSQLTFI